jgi:sterol desaturase/sphingolipid hydroxylase (fatty acid hydroxylase superfamily)
MAARSRSRSPGRRGARASGKKDASAAFDWALVRARNGKSPATWLLYALNGFLVLAAGLLVVLMWKRDEMQVGWKYEMKEKVNLLMFAIPTFIIGIFLEEGWFRLRGYPKRDWYRVNDAVTSISCAIYQQNTAMVFFRGLGLLPYAWVRERTAITYKDEEVTVVNWILCFVLLEYGYYWLHRFAHEFNVMWAGHAVHHSGQDYNLATALRQSWWQGVYSWCFYLFLAPFLPVRLFVWHSQFNLVYQFWIHTRVVDKLPAPIEFIFNTPSHHRVHHGRQPHYIDKNYGGTLIIFDRLFGTFQAEDVEVIYGVTTDLFDTWNVVWIQHAQFFECWETFKKMLALRASGKHDISLWECIRVWLDRGPGFNYEILKPELVANPPPVITRKTEVKHDSRMPNWYFNIYGMLHCGAIIPTVVVLMISPELNLSWTMQLLVFFFSTFSMLCIGWLFDRVSFGKTAEIVRLLLILAIGLLWLEDIRLQIGVAGFAGASLALLLTKYDLGKSEHQD